MTIDARDLSVWYGATQALHQVNLHIRARAITALVGPSGCGKSTLLRAINRMNDAIPGARSHGVVLLDGANVYASDVDVAALRKRVGMVFQRWNPFPRSIYDNVAFGPGIHGARRGALLDDIVERSLRRAALWDEVKDRLRESALALSGGQQQRLCIARALANDPEVLLLDEPTSALDLRSTQKIEQVLRELRREVTIVIVTHNLEQAARGSDDTVFFDRGRVVESGATDRVFANPLEPQTEAYLDGSLV